MEGFLTDVARASFCLETLSNGRCAVIDRAYSVDSATVGAVYDRPICSFETETSYKKAHKTPIFRLVSCVLCASLWLNFFYSTGSRRTFFRLRLRANACLIRFFSSGFR